MNWQNKSWRIGGFLLFLVLIGIGVGMKELWHLRPLLVPFHALGGVVLFLWGYSYANRESA